jgi:hypothetical protein
MWLEMVNLSIWYSRAILQAKFIVPLPNISLKAKINSRAYNLFMSLTFVLALGGLAMYDSDPPVE